VGLSGDGTLLVIGAPGASGAIEASGFVASGAAYVYRLVSATPVVSSSDFKVELVLEGASDYASLGRAVAASADGTVIAVAAPGKERAAYGQRSAAADRGVRAYAYVLVYEWRNASA